MATLFWSRSIVLEVIQLLQHKTDIFSFRCNPIFVCAVATDGLWEFITNEETCETVEGQIGPAQSVDTLVTEAGTRWMQEEQVIDDTTVIVANLFGWKSS